MADRKAELAAHAAHDERAAREDTLLDLLATWGACARPDAADLLRAISNVRNVSDLLRELQQRARGWLPASLQDEIDQTAAILNAQESLQAPSFRARLDRVLARAHDALDPRLAERRAALSEQLGAWALLMDRDQLGRTLECLWRSEGCGGVADQIAAIADLQQVESTLAATRESIASEVQIRIAACGQETTTGSLARARAAVGGGDPLALFHARIALEALQAQQTLGATAERFQQARTHLATLCDRARQRISADGGGLDGGGAGGVLARVIAETERALQAAAGEADARAELEAVLKAWQRTLEVALEAGAVSGAEELRAREAAVQAFHAEIARLAPEHASTQEAAQDTFARDAAAIEKTLRERSSLGGRPFQEALDRAGDLLRQTKRQDASRCEAAAARLRGVARDLASFIDKAGDQLPTARLVQARLWLEQVEGIAGARDIAGIDALGRTIEEDLAGLRELATHVQRRRANRLEAERDALRSEAGRLMEAAPRGAARRIEALATEAERADGRRLMKLRDDLEDLRTSVEQAVRLEAGKAWHAAERWRHRHGGSSTPRHPEKAQEVARCLDGVAAALQKSDLAALRDRAAELRSAMRGVALAARTWARAAGAVVAIGLLASLPLIVRYLGDRPQTFHLKLDAAPTRAVTIWLVRDGRIQGKKEYGSGDDGVSFTLPPGQYEVFVNERYTGRVVRIPGETEVTGVPLPPDDHSPRP